MNERSSPASRLVIVVGLVVIVLVATAAVVNAVRPVQQYARDTPEGTVQAFLTAQSQEDYAAAYALLSASAQDECEPADLDRDGDEPTRIVVEDVTEIEDQILVDVHASFVEASDSLEPYRYDQDVEFTLIRESGELKIDELSYLFCSG